MRVSLEYHVKELVVRKKRYGVVYTAAPPPPPPSWCIIHKWKMAHG